jgi:uncharacterized protein YjeT (DUF2065 family)
MLRHRMAAPGGSSGPRQPGKQLKQGVILFGSLGVVNGFVVSLQRLCNCGKFDSMKLLITLIGLILVLEGLPYVASPAAMQRWLRQLMEINPEQLRVMGIIAMAVGFLLCYLAQRTVLFG